VVSKGDRPVAPAAGLNLKKERSEMNEIKKKEADKSTWAIGGGVLMGVGTGFFFLKGNPLAFVGCILLGLGLGLAITAIISAKR
jgi:hypothetical protein